MYLRKQEGFSLVEMVVTLGISGLFTVMFLRYSLNSQNQDRRARFEASINQTISVVQYAITKPDVCTKVFKDLEIPTASSTDLELIADSRSILKVGTYEDFDVSSIKLADSALSTSSFDLVIQFRPRSTSTLNSYISPSGSLVTKRISIVGVIQASPKKVRSCGPIISDTNATAKEVFCLNLGAITTWNSTTKVCSFKNTSFTCPVGQVPYTFGTGGIYCTSILNASKLDLTKLFNFSTVDCASKTYTFYQGTDRKIAIGCPPSPTDRARKLTLPP